MIKPIVVPLSEPIVTHAGTVSAVELRRPSLLEYARIGEPYSIERGPDGNGVYVEHDSAIASYVEACVTSPDLLVLNAQASLRDAIAIKEAIVGFFIEARQARPKQPSPTPSSSTPS